jgi:hypothetical protein
LILSLLVSCTVAIGPAMMVATPTNPASSRMDESPSW